MLLSISRNEVNQTTRQLLSTVRISRLMRRSIELPIAMTMCIRRRSRRRSSGVNGRRGVSSSVDAPRGGAAGGGVAAGGVAAVGAATGVTIGATGVALGRFDSGGV
jgi:hypothetical protein